MRFVAGLIPRAAPLAGIARDLAVPNPLHYLSLRLLYPLMLLAGMSGNIHGLALNTTLRTPIRITTFPNVFGKEAEVARFGYYSCFLLLEHWNRLLNRGYARCALRRERPMSKGNIV